MSMYVDTNGKPLQIAIDGMVATGKTTVGVSIAKQLNILFLDTGVLYRSFTLEILEQKLDVSDEQVCAWIARHIDLRVLPSTKNDGRTATIMIGNRDVTWDIRSGEVNHSVPTVSAHPRVREVTRSWQHSIANKQPIVMVGRDITSVVLPNAQVKIMLTATLDERVRRRAAEMRNQPLSTPIDLPQLRQEIVERDGHDLVRINGTTGTRYIDTTDMSIAEVIQEISYLVQLVLDPTGPTYKLPARRPSRRSASK